MMPVALMLCSGLTTAAATTVGDVCEEEACDADASLRVVEYFGADWCEPCRPVEAMLDALERPDLLVIRHSPSPQDAEFSNLSYQRFERHYGLISLPAIVIDGYAVLTGETMTLRLEEALNATEGGRTNLTQNITTWSSSVHAPSDPKGMDVNVSSTRSGSANGTWTVTLHDPLPLRALEAPLSASAPPTGSPTAPLSGLELSLLTAVLVGACAPASVMLWRSMKQSRQGMSEEES